MTYGLANVSPSAAITAEVVLEACDKLRRLQPPPPSFDCLVCLEAAYDRLRTVYEPAVPCAELHGSLGLYGVEVHVADSESAMLMKAVELMLAGRRVAVVDRDGRLHEFTGLGDYVRPALEAMSP